MTSAVLNQTPSRALAMPSTHTMKEFRTATKEWATHPVGAFCTKRNGGVKLESSRLVKQIWPLYLGESESGKLAIRKKRCAFHQSECPNE